MNSRAFAATFSIVLAAVLSAIALLETAVMINELSKSGIGCVLAWPACGFLESATIWALWIGAAIWLLASYIMWERISAKSGYSAVLSAMLFTLLAAASVVGAVGNMPQLAMFQNAIYSLLLVAAAVIVAADELAEFDAHRGGIIKIEID